MLSRCAISRPAVQQMSMHRMTLRSSAASRPRVMCQVSAPQKQTSQPDGREAGNNPVGKVIEFVYGVGGPSTIKWGVIKSKVEPPQDTKGTVITWEDWREKTEARRQQLREEFAERLEVISFAERQRRATVGWITLAITAAAAAYAAGIGASTGARLALAPLLFLGIGFVDSSIQGLCTESWAGAWDVDDTGLEYMPTADLARKIQAKVAFLYMRDGLLTAALLYGLCQV